MNMSHMKYVYLSEISSLCYILILYYTSFKNDEARFHVHVEVILMEIKCVPILSTEI
jgi:hypothetical protein